MVALIVLNVPIVSISSTVLNAFSERPEMEERKLPAAPVVWTYQYIFPSIYYTCKALTTDDKVNAAKRLNRFGHGVLDSLGLPHITLAGKTPLARRLRQLLRCLRETIESLKKG